MCNEEGGADFLIDSRVGVAHNAVATPRFHHHHHHHPHRGWNHTAKSSRKKKKRADDGAEHYQFPLPHSPIANRLVMMRRLSSPRPRSQNSHLYSAKGCARCVRNNKKVDPTSSWVKWARFCPTMCDVGRYGATYVVRYQYQV